MTFRYLRFVIIGKRHNMESVTQKPISLTYPVRIVTAASLFDGHDAAINIMRRLMQASGAEVIHFYAHWCGPCIREIKMIAAEHARLKALGLDFVFVTDDTWERISQMQLILPPDIRIMRVTSLKDLGVYTIPATYIVNARNEVVFERIDACNWADSVFLQQIKTLLE